MVISERLRAVRRARKLSQGDIERRTGLLRAYLSRVENGHTVPSLETLEKLAYALGVPLYQLFYEGKKPLRLPNAPKRKTMDALAWGSSGKEARYFARLRRQLSRMDDADRQLLLALAQKMAGRRRSQ